jgi:hypothetical protein
MSLCKICKKKAAFFDYGLCVDCDLWLIEHRKELPQYERLKKYD